MSERIRRPIAVAVVSVLMVALAAGGAAGGQLCGDAPGQCYTYPFECVGIHPGDPSLRR